MKLSDQLNRALMDLGTDENVQKIFKLPRPNAINITNSLTNKGLSITGAYIFPRRQMVDFLDSPVTRNYLFEWLAQREFPLDVQVNIGENKIKISTILPREA